MKITKENFRQLFEKKILRTYGKIVEDATLQEIYTGLGLIIKDHIGEQLIRSKEKNRVSGKKQVYYLSIEFLIGRLLGSNVLNLGLYDIVKEGLSEFDIDFSELEDVRIKLSLLPP